jgi:hypothetical protein
VDIVLSEDQAIRPYDLSILASLLTGLLGLQACMQIAAIGSLVVHLFAAVLFVITCPVLFVWLHRLRWNAEVPGRVHRWAPVWVVGMWFVPALNLVLPYQFMVDIARAGVPRARAGEATRQVLAWWLSWLVGLTAAALSVNFWFFSFRWVALLPTWVGGVFLALASALLIVVVQRLSALHPADERLTS